MPKCYFAMFGKWNCAFLILLTVGFLFTPVRAVEFVYDNGTFGGQRGLGMIFGPIEDNGRIEHWQSVPDPNPTPAVDRIELHDPLVGQARLEITQEGNVHKSRNFLELWNHGRVDAFAASAGARRNDWSVASRGITTNPNSQAHADSNLQRLAYTIVPSGANEAIGDPIWL